MRIISLASSSIFQMYQNIGNFFTKFKDRLKARFDQLDVWITSHPMDVI